MKYLDNIIYLALILFITSCAHSPKSAPIDKWVSMKICPSNCKIPGKEFQISKACADCWQENYRIAGVFPQHNGENIRGFHIAHKEMNHILRENPDSLEVWSMFGINKHLVENVEKIDPEMVFVVKNIKEKEVRITYYDFTTPCPDACVED